MESRHQYLYQFMKPDLQPNECKLSATALDDDGTQHMAPKITDLKGNDVSGDFRLKQEKANVDSLIIRRRNT